MAKKIRTHIEHGSKDSGDRMVADLYETENGWRVHINIEVNEIQVAHIESDDPELKLWEEIIL